jgi:hypothetical protein
MSASLTFFRALLPKLSGLVLMLFGVGFLYRGATQLGEPGLPPGKSTLTYVMSRQVEDIGTGCLTIMFGVMAYRFKVTASKRSALCRHERQRRTDGKSLERG